MEVWFLSPSSATGKRKKLLALALVFFLVLAGSGGAYYWFFVRQAAAEGEAANKAERLRSITLSSFTVNLADPGARRFLRTTIALEYSGSGNAVERALQEREHRVRDAIIGVLRSKTVADIKDPEKTLQLRHELVQAINQVLEQDQIRDVFFREFIIQ
jgi:flagellar FliL protein